MTSVPTDARLATGARHRALVEPLLCAPYWATWIGLVIFVPGPLRGSNDPAPAVLTVYMRDAEGCAPRVLDEMHAEVAEIMRPAGIFPVWRSLDAPRYNETVTALIVLTFAGACRGEGHCHSTKPSTPLGWTHSSDGEILPFCVVDCDRVRQVVGSVIQCERTERRDRLYGRALGRVVAHEMYHVLANTTAHARSGLAKPLLDASELISNLFRFGAKEIELLRRAAHRGVRASGSRQDDGQTAR